MGARLTKAKAQNGTSTPISKAVLTRLESGNQGTFGKLVYNGFVCFTGELPDRNNAPSISCIPKGLYQCQWTYSPRMKHYTYELVGVNGRTAIRIHSANFMGDSELGFYSQLNGCVALGQKLGTMDGQKAILLSKPAIRQFEDLMNKKDFMLEII